MSIVEWKVNPLSEFPKRKAGKPNIFVSEKGDKTRYACFDIKEIYFKLFVGIKKRAGAAADDSVLISFKNPHIVKKDKELLEFLLPKLLIEKIENAVKNGKKSISDNDFKEFLGKSTNNKKITNLLFDIFSSTKRDSEKNFIKSIQTHFINLLKDASFSQPQLKNFLTDFVDSCIAPVSASRSANAAFHTLIDSKKHDDISKAVANVFISAILGLYSVKYNTEKVNTKRNYKFERTYLLNCNGMEFIWTPETISDSYVKLQDAVYSYECARYEESYKRALLWLAECYDTASDSEKASGLCIIGSCLYQHPDSCIPGKLSEENKEKLFKFLPKNLLAVNSSSVKDDAVKKRMSSKAINLLEKCVSKDQTKSEAIFLLYTYYDGKTDQALDYLSQAYAQSYVKAVIEVANRCVKGLNLPIGITDSDVIDKLTYIIFNDHNYLQTDIRECLYLRGRLTLKLDGNQFFAMSDFAAAAKIGHENARKELSRKERMELQRFPSFSDRLNAPCCFANSLDGNNLVFVSTLPDGEWRVFAAEQNDSFIDKAVRVNNVDEFISEQYLDDFDSYAHKVVLLFMSEDADRNLNECLVVLDRLFNIALRMQEDKRNNLIDNIVLFVEAEYEIASTLIDANINDMGDDIYFKVHIVDEARDSAHQLLCDAPLFLSLISDKKREESINVVLFGCSKTNYRIIKESIACAYLGKEYPITITMLGADADRMERRLKQECPGIFSEPYISCIRPKFISCRIEEEDFPSLIYKNADDEPYDNELKEILSVGNYFVVDLSSDQDSIRFGMELRTWFLRSGGTFDRTPIICVKCRNSQNSYLASHLTLSGQAAGDTYYSRYDLFPFGIARALYSYNRLVKKPRLEEVALEIHKSYYKGGKDRQAENDYFSFSYNADSCLLTAIGIIYRFFAVGAYFSQKEQYLNFGAFDSDTLLSKYDNEIKLKEEFAAYLEQSRWNGFMLSRGWEPADINQVRAYKDQLTGSSHKHTLAKRHPFIREWDDLNSDELTRILRMLQSKFDYKKHPAVVTRNIIRDTSMIIGIPVKNNAKEDNER